MSQSVGVGPGHGSKFILARGEDLWGGKSFIPRGNEEQWEGLEQGRRCCLERPFGLSG